LAVPAEAYQAPLTAQQTADFTGRFNRWNRQGIVRSENNGTGSLEVKAAR
jgi:hypothetical protein